MTASARGGGGGGEGGDFALVPVLGACSLHSLHGKKQHAKIPRFEQTLRSNTKSGFIT